MIVDPPSKHPRKTLSPVAKIVRGFLAVGAIGMIAVSAFPVTRSFFKRVVHPGWGEDRRFTLPNGWRLTPAGDAVVLPGDMPANIRVLSDGTHALVNTCGYHDHSLNLVDLTSGKVIQSIKFNRSWVGLGLLPNGDALVSGGLAEGSNEAVHRIGIGSDLVPTKGFDLAGIPKDHQFVSSILPIGDRVLLLNIQSDEVILLNKNQQELARAKVGYRPFGAALSPDGSTVAISDWGDKTVELLSSKTLERKTSILTRAMPSSLLYAPDGRLFVAESGSNTVAIIDGGVVSERVRTGLSTTIPVGVTPVGLALSPDSNTLYVADAGNNCVTVVDVRHKGESKAIGLIPTARYPTSVAVTPDGKRLLVATAKGFYGPNAVTDENNHLKGIRHEWPVPYRYIPFQLEGRLAIVDVPNAQQLRQLTKLCADNRPRGMAAAPAASVCRAIQHGAFDKIKHVIYVIRENRTYDQVLGDIGKGESDPSLTVFGRKVTPNGHKIAETFTLFDNLYTDGEVSQAGHQWTDSAYANDYNEHAWILDYSDRGEIRSDKRLTSSPGDYIWSLARKKGRKARVFGEYVDIQEDHVSLQDATIKADPEKYGYSAAFERIFARGGWPGGPDTEKVDEFLGEMKNAEVKGNWPDLMVMALPYDHTRGFSAGALSPYAMVGINDQAIGKLIDGVSHSKFWKDTAIFIIEDDAQDGADHVDSHRTVGLVVSPYIRRGFIDSTMYSTSSMLRTMELILHLPPMTQYDANATPMYAAFTDVPILTPYEIAPPQVDLNERNPARTALARRSAKLDFTDEDRADPDEFNHILWEGYRPHDPYPATLR